jgi:serine phosphatase RsbU (regulator of sigma subunit)
VAKYKGVPYIATDKGIEKLNVSTNSFEATAGITDEGWALQSYNDVLLAGTNVGLYEIDASGSKFILDWPDGVFHIYIDPKKPDILYLAGRTTLAIVRYKNHKIEPIKVFEDASSIRSAASDKEGRIFFGSISSVVYMLDPALPDSLRAFQDKEWEEKQPEIFVFSYNGNVLACTGVTQMFSFNKDHFEHDPHYNVFEKRKLQTDRAVQSGNDIWLATSYNGENGTRIDELTVLKNNGSGKFYLDYKLLKRVRELTAKCFLVDTDAVFIGTNDGLIEYNTHHLSRDYKFNTFISKITQNNDTAKFVENYCQGLAFPQPEFAYNGFDIRFFAAASDYYDKNELEFSYYLEGKDTGYCEWDKNSRIMYNSLHEGHYVFHLKCRNILGTEGNPITFAFTVLPPWYRTYWAYALYLLGSVALIWFIVQYNTRRLKEQNIKLENIITERTKEIEHQKEEIEHKNQEITDSINYAKRIQQAILPPVNEILKVWKDVFVFYQPKDIVSGDFYWFYRINDHEMLIACADCTGHGVPGGFMSMICSDKLNDAVKETHDPAKILFHVNNNVKKALRQTETSDENVNKDGMEISLVRINFQTSKVWYAGANRPLWMLKKSATEIEEVKPTKASIASFTPSDFEYQGHELQLEKNDLVYMTSDGYPDQFGGQDGKKFMTKNFKKLILSIKDLGIREQESTVRNVINQWKEGYEQVDDLLVIAFKL